MSNYPAIHAVLYYYCGALTFVPWHRPRRSHLALRSRPVQAPPPAPETGSDIRQVERGGIGAGLIADVAAAADLPKSSDFSAVGFLLDLRCPAVRAADVSRRMCGVRHSRISGQEWAIATSKPAEKPREVPAAL